MKVSLICTTLNEEKNIEELMRSIKNQTKKPDEIIFVDAGSTDRTVKLIKKYRRKIKNLRIYTIKGCTIGKGRNFAIKKAKHELIATTDAGCVLDKNWLNNLLETYKKFKPDVVSGCYDYIGKNNFENAQGKIMCKKPEELPDNNIPSSRSALFTKKAWRDVGGYPENSNTAEDSMFNYKLQKTGKNFKISRKAIVHWMMRPTYKDFFIQFLNYGKGDGINLMPVRVFINPSNTDAQKSFIVLIGLYIFLLSLFILSYFQNYSLLIIFLSLFFLFLLYPIFSKKFKKNEIIHAAILLIIKRFAYFLGVHIGMVKSLIRLFENVS